MTQLTNRVNNKSNSTFHTHHHVFCFRQKVTQWLSLLQLQTVNVLSVTFGHDIFLQ